MLHMLALPYMFLSLPYLCRFVIMDCLLANFISQSDDATLCVVGDNYPNSE